MKKFLLLFILISVCIGIPRTLSSQTAKKVLVEGVVTEHGRKEPIEGCLISIPALELWAVTDAMGRFKFSGVKTGIYILEAACLGYEPLKYSIVVDQPLPQLSLHLKPASLLLDTVTVTARRGQDINTSSVIDRQAIDHLQATSVKDVLQLLPGVLTTNPDLTKAGINFASIRDLPGLSGEPKANSLNSNSVGVYVDGAQVSNDALIVGQGASSFGQIADRGIDLRRLSTDNIESVEVIRGVAPAQYGDISSGAIIVKTKKGRTPYMVRMKVVPDTKLISLNKGYSLCPNKGFLNTSFDYARAMGDIRTIQNAFDRGTFSVGYTQTFNRDRTPLLFQAVVSGYLARDSWRPDPDNISLDERTTMDDRSVSVNINGSWLLDKPWITSLKYRFISTTTRQYARKKSATSALGIANPGAMQDGEYMVEYTPDIYMNDIRNLSLAHYIQSGLTAEVSGRYGILNNKAMAGIEWRGSANTGKGVYYAGTRPLQFRPESFDDIPFLHRIAFFAEEQASLPVGSTSLTLQAGVRVEYMPNDVLKKDYAVDPRLNIRYDIIPERDFGVVRKLSPRMGWGIQTKLPSIRQLYPLPVYNDRNSFSWGGTAESGPMSAWTTFVTPRSQMQNADLKMQHSRNLEAGLDFDLCGIRGSAVYYNEKMRNGYSLRGIPLPVGYREYASYSGTQPPVYIDDPANPGDKILSANGQPLDYSLAQVFHLVTKPANDRQYDKWGVEYILDLGQIRSLRTSFVANGAYISITSRENGGALLYDSPYSFQKIPVGTESSYNPFLAAYNGGKAMEAGLCRSRLNTNLSMITHIPPLRLVVSLTIQCVWLDRSRLIRSEGVYTLGENGEPVYNNITTGGGNTFYKDPDYYMNSAGKVLSFDRDLYNDPVYGTAYRAYMQSANSTNYFAENSFRPYFMANLRITKEIGNIAQVSFYANNFTNSRPQMKLQNTGGFVRVNTDMYFGAELNLKF